MRLINKLKLLSAMVFMLVIVVSSSMVFAADPNTWTTKAPLNTVRYNHEAVVLNGQIYVIGGTAYSTLSSVEQYDPATDTWTTKAPMSVAREGHQLAVIGGKIYAVGGGATDLKSVEEYNPETNTWTTKASMAYGRDDLATVVLNGKIYAIGGSQLTSVEEYDPANNIWVTKAPMSVGRQQFKAAVVNGKIYAIGGYNSTGKYLNSVEEYDPVTDTWTTKAPMYNSRSSFNIAVINDKIYVIGGVNSGTNNVSASIEEYDPANNIWTLKTSMPTGGGKAVVLNNKIYMVGASGSKTLEYDPATDKWTYLAPVLAGRTDSGVAVVNGKIYAIGGRYGGATLKSVEEYTPTNTGDPGDGGSENPPVITGNSAILELTMVNGVIKEYDLNAAELDSFLTWYDNSSTGVAPAYYIFNKKNNIKPFLSRKEYIAYSKIASFEVKEYAE
ncbi:Kelch repeat-containing protein [Ruminiclostridium josui]|uniref:Kelch repeat-containing protein n=1 Tax=Ruminiclostridium josui TaxID=1499 RepID=UPI000463C22C|nr:kelch repeat-containing protein [Ruminiclostridium josui]